MPELGISSLVPRPPRCLSLAVQKSTAVTEGWVWPGTRLMYVATYIVQSGYGGIGDGYITAGVYSSDNSAKFDML